jgi:hypothetical protein
MIEKAAAVEESARKIKAEERAANARPIAQPPATDWIPLMTFEPIRDNGPLLPAMRTEQKQ